MNRSTAVGWTIPPLAGLCLLAGPVAAQRDAPPADSFRVRDSMVAAERGAMDVPERRSEPTSRRLTLRYVRFASRARAPGPPIVFLAGGPGDAATRAFAGMPGAVLDSLRSVADVIAFDQRGTGLSTDGELRCPAGAPLPLDEAATEAAVIEQARAAASGCLRLLAERGVDVRGYTTAESADDVEALRRQLGVPRVTLLAGSYGTHLALAVVRRHPRSVASLVLAGVEGPDDTVKRPAEVEAALNRVLALARQTPAVTELLPNPHRALALVLDSLRASPRSVQLPGVGRVVVGAYDLQRLVAEALGDTRREAQLPALIHALAVQDDFTPLARWSAAARAPRPLDAMHLAMDCASYASEARLRQRSAEAASTLLGGAIDAPLPGVCDVPGLPQLGDDFRAPLRSDVPALLVSGTIDGRTPPANAAEVARGMPAARLLTVEHAAHSLIGLPEVMAATLAFLRGAPTPSHLVVPAPRFDMPTERGHD